jgi:hypothetical protein
MSLENKIKNLILSKLAPPDFTPGLDTFSGDVRDEKVDCSSAPDPDECERVKQENATIAAIVNNPPGWLRVGCSGAGGCSDNCGDDFCNRRIIEAYAACEAQNFNESTFRDTFAGFACGCTKENYNFQTRMFTGPTGPVCDIMKALWMEKWCAGPTDPRPGDCSRLPNGTIIPNCFDGIPFPPSVANALGVPNGPRAQLNQVIAQPGYSVGEWMQVRNKWAANATICRTDYCWPHSDRDLMMYTAEQHGGQPRHSQVAIPDTDPVEYTMVCTPWDPNSAGPDFWNSYWARVSERSQQLGEVWEAMYSGNTSGQVVDGVPIPNRVMRLAYDLGCMGKPYQEQMGACCKPAGDFGGFECSQTRSEDCSLSGGTFHPGATCQEIGGGNCGASSPTTTPNNNSKEVIEDEKVVKSLSAALIKSLRGKK